MFFRKMLNQTIRYARPAPVRLTAPAATGRGHGMRRLLREYRERKQLHALADEALDFASAAHLVSVSIQGETAVLTFDDANWLTRARYAQPKLLARLNQDRPAAPVRKIRFQVRPRPRQGAGNMPRTRRPRMSMAAGKLIRDASRGIQDPDLRRALEKLACRAHG